MMEIHKKASHTVELNEAALQRANVEARNAALTNRRSDARFKVPKYW